MIAVNDPAGTGIQFCRAVNRHSPHTCRMVTLETRYNHCWDKDLHLPDLGPEGLDELRALLASSDVFHFHMTADEDLALGPFSPREFIKGKAVVHHHHGHPDFRGDPDKYRRKYARLGRRNLLVSTPDLLRLLPEAMWMPNLVPLDEPGYRPLDRDWQGPLRIAHSPTRKELKNTGDLLAAIGVLRSRGLDLDLELIDDAPHAECLARKQRCHVLFDHMQGYYGVSSLEGMSQGLAVIAGLSDWCREKIAEFAGTDELPWLEARDRAELVLRLRELCADRELCAQAGRRGREFMVGRWSDARLAMRLADFYQRL